MASNGPSARVYSPLKLMVDTQIRTRAQKPPKSLSLAGKTAIITGSNTGLGLECARVMLDNHLTCLIMAVRTVSKGELAAESLRKSHPDANIQVRELDMLSYNSIQSFVSRCWEEFQRIDLAILNASIFPGKFVLSPESGHEESIQVNYLSTALLAISLVPVLRPTKKSPHAGRLTIVSSNVALTCQFPERHASPLLPAFNDAKSFHSQGNIERYCTSKLLQTMLVQKLANLVSPSDVVINTVDPGLTAGSDLHRYLSAPARAVFWAIKTAVARPAEHAAWLYLDAAAVRGEESHGGFVVNWQIYP